MQRSISPQIIWTNYWRNGNTTTTGTGHTAPIIEKRYFQLSDDTPYSDEVYELYNPSAERTQNPNYKADLELRRLKRSL